MSNFYMSSERESNILLFFITAAFSVIELQISRIKLSKTKLIESDIEEEILKLVNFR